MSVNERLSTFRSSAAAIGKLEGARAEQSLYGPFESFLEGAASDLGTPLLIVHQVGAAGMVPDFGVYRGHNVVGWVELKAPNKDLDALTGADRRQHERALADLEAFILTNGWDWRLYVLGAEFGRCVLGRDFLRSKVDPLPVQVTELESVLAGLFTRSAAPVTNIDQAVSLMAQRAQAVRRAVEVDLERPNALLEGLFGEFAGLVYASGREYTKRDFADAYAQTFCSDCFFHAPSRERICRWRVRRVTSTEAPTLSSVGAFTF